MISIKNNYILLVWLYLARKNNFKKITVVVFFFSKTNLIKLENHRRYAFNWIIFITKLILFYSPRYEVITCTAVLDLKVINYQLLDFKCRIKKSVQIL